jgi:hypothetical protein
VLIILEIAPQAIAAIALVAATLIMPNTRDALLALWSRLWRDPARGIEAKSEETAP